MDASLKPLVAGLVLALSSTVALAQTAPTVPTQPQPIPAGGLPSGGTAQGNGPLLIAAWDIVTNSSVVQWLGLTYDDVDVADMTVPGTVLDFGTVGTWSTTFADAIAAGQTSRIQYLVVAADSFASPDLGDPYSTGLRVTGQANLAESFNTHLSDGNQVAGAGNQLAQWVEQTLNQPFPSPTACNFANPCSIVNNEASPLYFGRPVLGADLGGNVNAGTSYGGFVGTALSFFDVVVPDDPNYETFWANATQYAGGSWLLGADGSLSYSVAPVPLPAALWMLISGLAGLGVVSRRRAA